MAVVRVVCALVAALAVAACTDNARVIQPVIDVPVADDPDATASGLSTISLAVAHAGKDGDLASQRFAPGQALELPNVPFGDDLVIHMSGLVDQSTIAYGRTCVVAVDPDGPPPAPHLFFTRTQKFATTTVQPLPRIGGLGIAYRGAALLVGGTDESGEVTSVERFDPLTGQLTVLGPVFARDRAVAALIGTSPPRAVLIGGSAGGRGATVMEVIDDQRIDRVDDVAGMARVDLTATALTDGRVMVIGGAPPGGAPVGDIIELADHGGPPNVRKLVAALFIPRSGHTATRLGDDVGAPVLIAGGVDAAGAPIDMAELFKPLREELVDHDSFHPAMQVPRHGHVATLMPDGSVLFIGGLDAGGQPVAALELFSVDGGFNLVGALPQEAGLVDFAATTLPDGRILVTGGVPAGTTVPTDHAYIIRLNPLDGMVDIVATDRMATVRAGHHAQLLCDGTVLITGGAPGDVAAERYNPPSSSRR